MTTNDAFALSMQNTRTYESQYGTLKDGYFSFNEEAKKIIRGHGFEYFARLLFNESGWKIKQDPIVKKMTHDELENLLGYKVQIVEDDKKDTKDYDDFIDIFNRLFGLNKEIDDDDSN